MRGITPVVAGVVVVGMVFGGARPAGGQWSNDSSVNTRISAAAGDQTQAKIRPLPDGGCWVSWLDNRSGGYDTYVQRLDRQGYAHLPLDGLLVADTGFSSTQDYGFEVDPATGTAWVAFRDDRVAGQPVSANGIAPDGTLIWGTAGVALANSNGGNAPRLAVTPTGIVVGWSVDTGLRVQKLDALGAPAWATDIVEAPATGSYTLSELKPSEDGGVIALWVRGGGFSTPRHLYAQKYDAAGDRLWNGGQPRIVFDGSSIQFGNFPTFSTDGAGGAVFSWYETGGSRNAYVQRVDSSGAEVFAHNGVAVNTTAGRYRVSASHAYNAATGEIFVFWVETNTAQSAWGVYGQKVTAAGVRAWTDSGREVTPLDAVQESFVTAARCLDGAMVFWFNSGGTSNVLGARLSGGGAFVWTPAIISPSTRPTGKSRLDVNVTPSGMALLAWGDGTTGTLDILAQNVNPPGGTLGRPVFLHGDLDCNGAITFNDIDPFVLALSGPAAYEAAFPHCYWLAADANGDGTVNFDDIDPFVALIGS